jgi:hypothetical protein
VERRKNKNIFEYFVENVIFHFIKIDDTWGRGGARGGRGGYAEGCTGVCTTMREQS